MVGWKGCWPEEKEKERGGGGDISERPEREKMDKLDDKLDECPWKQVVLR